VVRINAFAAALFSSKLVLTCELLLAMNFFKPCIFLWLFYWLLSRDILLAWLDFWLPKIGIDFVLIALVLNYESDVAYALFITV
jgi:hypothetical protein